MSMTPAQKEARKINWLLYQLIQQIGALRKNKSLFNKVVPKRKRFIIEKIIALTENLIEIIKENR